MYEVNAIHTVSSLCYFMLSSIYSFAQSAAAAAVAVGTDTYLLLSNKLIAPHFHSLSNIHSLTHRAYPNPCFIYSERLYVCDRVYSTRSSVVVCESTRICFHFCIAFDSAHYESYLMCTWELHHTIKVAYIKKTKPTRRKHSSSCTAQRNGIKQTEILIPVTDLLSLPLLL